MSPKNAYAIFFPITTFEFVLYSFLRFKQNVAEDQSTSQVICAPKTTSLQFVGDNTDHNINTSGTHQGLGPIVVDNGDFSGESKQKKTVPRNKKQISSTVDFN